MVDEDPAINGMVPPIISRLGFLLIPVAVVVMRRIRHFQTVELVHSALHAGVTMTMRLSILVGLNTKLATDNRFVINI